jgi:hypothetical protein
MTAQKHYAYASRPESVRRSNEQIAAAAKRLQFVSRVPMRCECSDPGCNELILITLENYRKARRGSLFLAAPGHASR